jgi:hypothetical protein
MKVNGLARQSFTVLLQHTTACDPFGDRNLQEPMQFTQWGNILSLAPCCSAYSVSDVLRSVSTLLMSVNEI